MIVVDCGYLSQRSYNVNSVETGYFSLSCPLSVNVRLVKGITSVYSTLVSLTQIIRTLF